MRLFTALELTPDMLLRVEELLSVLRPEADIKWSPPDNLHITTKFIGEWPDSRLEELDAVLQKLRARQSLEIEVRELDWFPNTHSPRGLFARVHGRDDLTNFALQVEEALVSMGISKDPHDFSPHLTLARIRNPVSLQRLRVKVEELQKAIIGNYRASSFYLYRSDPGSNASIYRKIRTYPFQPKS